MRWRSRAHGAPFGCRLQAIADIRCTVSDGTPDMDRIGCSPTACSAYAGVQALARAAANRIDDRRRPLHDRPHRPDHRLPDRRHLVASGRRLPGLPAQLRRQRWRRPGGHPRPHLTCSLSGRPGCGCNLAQPVLSVGPGRRRLRRRRLPRRAPPARQPRRLRRPRRGVAHGGPEGDRRHRAQPHLRLAPVVRRGARLRAGVARPSALHLPRRQGPGRLPATVGLDLPLRWLGLDPCPGRSVVLPPVRPRAARPELGQPRGPGRLLDHAAVLVGPGRGRLQGRRGARPGQGPVRAAAQQAGARGPSVDAHRRHRCALRPRRGARDLRRVAPGLRLLRPAADRGRRGVRAVGASRPVRPADRVGPGLQLRSAQGRLRRRRLPRRHHLLPGSGRRVRLLLDLGAVQPRRRPARHPLRPAQRDGPRRVADVGRQPAAGRTRRPVCAAPGPRRP